MPFPQFSSPKVSEWVLLMNPSSSPEEPLLGHSQKNPVSNQASLTGTHTLWTYGQSPIVCCAIYGSVACHLFCLSETSMTPVWILSLSGRRLLSRTLSLYITSYLLCSFLMRLTAVKMCSHNDCQKKKKSKNRRGMSLHLILYLQWQHATAKPHFYY